MRDDPQELTRSEQWRNDFYTKMINIPWNQKIDIRDAISKDSDDSPMRFKYTIDSWTGMIIAGVRAISNPLDTKRILKLNYVNDYYYREDNNDIPMFLHASFSPAPWNYVCNVPASHHELKKRYIYDASKSFEVWFTYDGRNDIVKFEKSATETDKNNFFYYDKNFVLDLSLN
jgi:hypothetical protein